MPDDDSGTSETFESLAGQALIAMPGMLDSNFADTVVLICTHTREGAMGLIVNRPAETVTFRRLVKHLDLLGSGEAGDNAEDDAFPDRADDDTPDDSVSPCPVVVGGPVEPSRGFVLHSPDYYSEGNTVRIIPDVCLTATVDILRALARGKGPEHALLALGYAAWDSGQLEREFQANGWLHTPATSALVFETALDKRYSAAFAALGIDPSFLVTSGGTA